MQVNFVEVLQDRIGKSKGCAVVDFKTRDDAMKCVENLHRIELRGRLIVAKEIRVIVCRLSHNLVSQFSALNFLIICSIENTIK